MIATLKLKEEMAAHTGRDNRLQPYVCHHLQQTINSSAFLQPPISSNMSRNKLTIGNTITAS